MASQASPQEPLTIVGIGASAGGLAALRAFFEQIPADSGIAYVVVVHLSPDHKSHLAELLQPHVPMPVLQVTETSPLLPNQVYVIPPNSNLSTIDTHLRLSELEEKRRDRAPIDHFFRTLARTHDGNSVGVVLTGTGSDGTLGLKEIKACGGLTVVQDPNDAEYDGMPQSAIATGLIDLVLPLTEIPSAILRYSQIQPRIHVPEEGESLEEDERRLLQKVFAQIRTRTGRDFSHYKRSTILRRIGRRMQFHHIEELSHYLDLLRKNADEARSLADDLLITVTSFFRNKEVFELLEQEIIPRLFQNQSQTGESVIRVWSVGCASGEEAYSLAILLLEAATRLESPVAIQVFASDLHEHSLARAREGFYPGDIETDISEARLKRFFQKQDSGYRIRKEVRELVVFAPHNLLADPPFSRIDLITCRNLLIYLQRDIQSDVIELFHYALKPEGVLVLGTSETLDSAELFRSEDKKRCVFRKRNVPAPEPRLPVFPLIRTPLPGEKERPERPREPVSFGKLHQRMVELYAPPSMLISPDDKVVHLSAHAGRYLVHPGGELTASVFKLVRDELRIELRAALSAVRERDRPLTTRAMGVRFDGDVNPVILHVRPSLEPHHEGFALVIFEELDSPPPHPHQDAPAEDAAGAQVRVRELDTELNLAQQRLQSIIEEYETSQEELKASNEELQSANEELRSTMEELETSKEELQSMNEELQTVNQENRHKVEELAQLTGDLQNLLAATDIATIYLDRDLRIMRFTPKVTDLFSVRMTDRGRPLTDFTHRLGYDEMQNDARRVLAELTPIEREVQDEADRWYLTRIRPYRSSVDRIEGVVATFIEITARKEAEERLRRNEQQFRALVEQTEDYAIFVTDPAGIARTWNVGVERILGFREEEFVGQNTSSEIFTPEDQAHEVPQQELETAAQEGSACNDRWMRRKDGSRFWASGFTTALRDDQGALVGYMKVMRDHTERKHLEDELRRLAADMAEANRRKDEFLATLAHELRNPLSPIRSGLDLIQLARDDGELVSESLAMIERQAQQLIRLVDDLLDVSRITRGKLELRCRILPLNEVLENALEAARPFIDESGHQLMVELPPPEICVHADPNRLAQIFANLLNNAAKYTPIGGHLALTAQREGDEVCVTVSDDGIGIPSEMLAHIFEMFGQVNQTGETNSGGLGIGLTLVKSLVEMHQGSISVHSGGKNQGSRFVVRLPILASTAERVGQAASRPLSPPAHQLRVLVVDDNR